MLKKILLAIQNIEEIVQNFFVSGHSYNGCDRCFGLIEKQKRFTSNIFVVEQWIQLISRAKKTEPLFYVKEMKSDMFFSTNNLQNLIVNRKKNVDGTKINWFKIRQIKMEKNYPFSLYIRQKNGDSMEKIDLEKKHITLEKFNRTDLINLNKGYRLISVQKYNDLQSLLKYVPSTYHDFFRNSKVDDDSIDIDYNLASESESDNMTMDK